jgi:hypothetical protein
MKTQYDINFFCDFYEHIELYQCFIYRHRLEWYATKLGIHDSSSYKNKKLLFQAIKNKWVKHFQDNRNYYEENFEECYISQLVNFLNLHPWKFKTETVNAL